MILKSNTNRQNISQIAKALDASGYIALSIDVNNDHIDISRSGSEADRSAEVMDFPKKLSSFLQRVNPMDLPGLTEDLRMHGNDATYGAVQVVTSFRYRFDSGKIVNMQLKGEMHTEEGGHKYFSGLLAQEAIKQDISNTQRINGALYSRELSTRDSVINSIEHSMACNGDKGVMDAHKGFLLVAGIDRFSLYNQAYGAQFVDQLLYDIEQKFKSILEPFGADVARLGGDQYALLFNDVNSSEINHIAHSVLGQINNILLETAKGPIRINFSMGGVSFAEKAKHASDYIVMAEVALAKSKDSGRGRFTSYSKETVSSSLDTRKLLKSADGFLQAYEEGRFRLAFQPVVGANSGHTNFYECLLRIIDENDRIIPAGAFMEKVEDFGLVHIADQFALHQAVEELEQFPDIVLSVNVSNASVNNNNWLRSAVALLRGRPQIATRLIVEITETTMMRDVKACRAVMNTLRDLGCKIALDDFGAGYTSFHQIREIRPDILKIDRYFASDLHLKENQVFVDAIQMLANGFSVETVGEGAETILDANHLKDRGVQNIQGYAYGHPSMKRLWMPNNTKKVSL